MAFLMQATASVWWSTWAWKWPFVNETKAVRVLVMGGSARYVHGEVQEEARLPVSDSARSRKNLPHSHALLDAHRHPFESTEG